ncbi:MAG: ATP-binding cassette domain-containing protein [Thermoplasmatota archaeon]
MECIRKGAIISVRDLVKTYGKLNAVDGISLDICRGEVFAFLGPNGAGKTTTVEIIEGIRDPTKGVVEILGNDISRGYAKLRDRIGVLPQEFTSFDKLTVRETISFYASLYKTPLDAEELIKLLNLGTHGKTLYQNLSGGLKQRVGIAAALVNNPEIIFLDEPTTGLDPGARQEVWKVIKKLKERGKTVFLTTHYMEEAQELADHVAIINHGRIVAEGTVEELIDKYGKGMVLTFTGTSPKIEKLLSAMGKEVISTKEDSLRVWMKDKNELLSILELVKGSDLEYRGINVRRSNLEEVFLTLTGEQLSEEEKR